MCFLSQVNGKELSKSSHEETVEAFHAAKEPVVVQVIRRTPSGRPHGPPQEIHVVDVCTQTDITFEHIVALAKLRPSTPPVPDVCPFLLSDRYVQAGNGGAPLFRSRGGVGGVSGRLSTNRFCVLVLTLAGIYWNEGGEESKTRLSSGAEIFQLAGLASHACKIQMN